LAIKEKMYRNENLAILAHKKMPEPAGDGRASDAQCGRERTRAVTPTAKTVDWYTNNGN
jgi:hypothetical protein